MVGTGLIGTSAGLAAAAAGYQVWLDDVDEQSVAVAESVGAGLRRPPGLQVDLALVAVPPTQVALVVDEVIRSGVATTVTHVSGVQLQPQLEIEAIQPGWSGFVGGHPIAGRERSGPHHASADLFRERSWVVCPTEHSADSAVTAVQALAQACGAVVRTMAAAEHDRLLARLSHLPQLVASALAGSLAGLGPEDLALAGSGLRDTTRLADSDPELWAEIARANRGEIGAALDAVIGPLREVREALSSDADAYQAVLDLVSAGRAGRSPITGKHGQAAVHWATVSVVVPDEPGALARLLADAAAESINVEDIRVDHSPGQPLGVVELDVAPGRAAELAAGLERRRWRAAGNEPVVD